MDFSRFLLKVRSGQFGYLPELVLVKPFLALAVGLAGRKHPPHDDKQLPRHSDDGFVPALLLHGQAPEELPQRQRFTRRPKILSFLCEFLCALRASVV